VGQLGGHGGVQNPVAAAGPSHLESPTFLAGTRTQPKLLHFNNNSDMSDVQIEKNEMGGACSKYGGRGEVYTGFW